MRNILFTLEKRFNNYKIPPAIKIGEKFFDLGTLFLPWAMYYGLLFFFISLSISLIKNRKEFYKDKFNYLILFVSALMFISAFSQNILFSNNFSNLNGKEIYLGLFNWVPLFFGFWAFQYYLKEPKRRHVFSRNLIIGSFPVFLSCIGQIWWGWESSIILLNKTIVWYQKPLDINLYNGISGLFSNPNYAGCWFSIIWPFSLAFFIQSKERVQKYFNFLIMTLTSYLLLLSGSRNALICLFISAILLIKLKYFILLVLIFTAFVFITLLMSIISPEINFLLEPYIPTKVFGKFKFNLSSSLLSYQRIEIWNKTISLIVKKPFIGWGASTFPIIYAYYGGNSDAQHTHNIFLQLAYDYGILVALIIFIFISSIIFKSIKLWKSKKITINSVDSYWIVASISSFIFHQVDFPYYDGRISIIFWILLAGIKNIVQESNKFGAENASKITTNNL